MFTDYHCHILPQIDDGSKSVEMSLEMLEMMKAQNMERVVATPHFYSHHEKSVQHYLDKRQAAFDKIMAAGPPLKNILLGAEVAIERDVSEKEGIEKLAVEGTNLILVELPYKPFSYWMIEEIENIAIGHKLTPVIAHVHRYQEYYSKADYDKILQLDAIFQVNSEAFLTFRDRNFVKKLIKQELPIIFGSDAHNVSDRKPDMSEMFKRLKKQQALIEASNAIFEKHKL